MSTNRTRAPQSSAERLSEALRDAEHYRSLATRATHPGEEGSRHLDAIRWQAAETRVHSEVLRAAHRVIVLDDPTGGLDTPSRISPEATREASGSEGLTEAISLDAVLAEARTRAEYDTTLGEWPNAVVLALAEELHALRSQGVQAP